ncbi:MAG: outer membrane lipoprotein carrier protein LolA [Verrucomicrobiota bacterium]|jgi:outer membrane lipoprotein-sorting protein
MVSLRSYMAVAAITKGAARSLLAAACILAARLAPAADTNAVLDSWFAAQSNTRTWSAQFTQTRALKSLTQPLVTTGRLWFAMPNRFRWELGQPPQTIALGRADEMYVIYPSLKHAEHYSLGADAPAEWRDALPLLQAGFPRGRADFTAQFQILSLTETNAAWHLVLVPRSASSRKMISSLLIDLAPVDFSLKATELIFADGSSMRNDFSNTVSNAALDDSLFQWTPPPDFKVTSPFAK